MFVFSIELVYNLRYIFQDIDQVTFVLAREQNFDAVFHKIIFDEFVQNFLIITVTITALFVLIAIRHINCREIVDKQLIRIEATLVHRQVFDAAVRFARHTEIIEHESFLVIRAACLKESQ